jgi:hypothetical protein
MKRKSPFLLTFLSILLLTACTSTTNTTPTISFPTQTPSDSTPPPASLEINDTTQIAGIGTYCWSGPTDSGEVVNVCADMIGIPTQHDPLTSSSPVVGLLTLPLAEAPSQLSLSAFEVSRAHELPETAQGYRWWSYTEGFTSQLPLQTSQEINVELEPGLYVFYVFAVWEGKGDVSYGFLVEVN